MHERTRPAQHGQVTAFLSHSWSDEVEAPGAKYAAIVRWAQEQGEATSDNPWPVEPTIWLVLSLGAP